jgi:hypothetical protein
LRTKTLEGFIINELLIKQDEKIDPCLKSLQEII